MDQKLIWLMIGPGTLPSQGVDRMDMLRYAVWISGRPPLTGCELIAALPEITRIAKLDVDDGNPYAIDSGNNLRALAARMQLVARRPEVGGIVFIQGTNSIEETAYFLNLTVRTDKPVIVTGAQRPFTALSSDAQLNLYDAVRVAASDEAKGKGVVVVTNGEINAARDVTKTNTYRVHTFRSRDLGLLGYADGDRIVFYRAPTRRHTHQSEFDVDQIGEVPRVDIIYIFTGARPDLAHAAVAAGAKGLVIAGSGAGSTGEMRKELAKIAAQGTVVVRSARVGDGRVIRDDNWQEPDMVAADNLSPHKAAWLLALALTKTRDPDTIQRMFDEY
ncbi:MAG: asparaginase [Xanthobacteraceae bacterium]|nr:asparaginase [Xanthobacteraceae bacterium]